MEGWRAGEGLTVNGGAEIRIRMCGNDAAYSPSLGDGSRMGDFRKLRVWQGAHKLSVEIRRSTRKWRGSGSGDLPEQLLSAAMSVPNNIIEGNAHKSKKEKLRFLGYALSSAWEVEGQLLLARDFELLSEAEFTHLRTQLIDVRGKLYGFIRTLSGIPRKKPPEAPDDDSL